MNNKKYILLSLISGMFVLASSVFAQQLEVGESIKLEKSNLQINTTPVTNLQFEGQLNQGAGNQQKLKINQNIGGQQSGERLQINVDSQAEMNKLFMQKVIANNSGATKEQEVGFWGRLMNSISSFFKRLLWWL